MNILAMSALVMVVGFTCSADGGPFNLRVRNSQPARYYLADERGKAFAPDGAIVYQRGAERHFVVRAGFEIELPPGSYTLTAERGPEYRPYSIRFDAEPGKKRDLNVAVSRWIDMNRLGWYSGDLHNHRRPEDMPALLLAEDLNLAPTLADWVWEDRQNSSPPATTEPVRQVDRTHVFSVLDKEVERLRNGPGALDLVGLRERIPFEGYLLYPPNDTFARQAHAQGGWVDAEKIVWRDVPALVALGLVDFAGVVNNHFNRQDVQTETARWGMVPKDRPEYDTPAGFPLWFMEVYYRFLNCGFRLPVSAGSASGVMQSPLGYNRVYVKPDGPFGYRAWFQALKQGRSFATNGPMLFLRVDGQEPGGVLRFPETHRRVRIQAEAVSLRPLDRLEIVFKGRTLRAVTGSGKLAAGFTTEVAESGWFAARAFEKPGRTVSFGQTSPVYVEFAADRGIVREDARFFIDWIDREMNFYRNLPAFRDPAHRKAMLDLFAAARQVYVRLAAQ